MRSISNQGQSITEYAIVFSVVAAAILGMQIFVKRGLQAKEKNITDYFTQQGGSIAGGTGTIGATAQYEPYYTAAGNYATETDNIPSTEKMTAGGKIAKTEINDTTTRTGSATQGADLGADDSWR